MPCAVPLSNSMPKMTCGGRPDRIERLPQQYFTRAARARRRRGGEGRRAARRLRPRESGGRAAAARDRGRSARGRGRALARLPAVPRHARAEGRDRRPLPRRLRGRARPGARGRGRAGDEDGARRALPRASRSAASTSCCPTRATRTTRPASRSRARRSGRCLSTPGLDARLRRGRHGAGRVPQLPVEPVRRRRPGRRLRRRGGWAERHGAASSTTSPTATSSSTAARRRASSPPPARRRSASRCSRCRSRTGWPGWRLGFVVGNAEIVERINLLQDHNRAGVFRAVQEAGIAALTGPQDSVDERRARYEAPARPRARRASGRAVSEGTFYVWIELPGRPDGRAPADGAPVALAPGEGFGAGGAGWARISLAVTDDVVELGLARLLGALEGTTIAR